jgi:hypothetical protein
MKIFLSMPDVKRPYIPGVEELPLCYFPHPDTPEVDADPFAAANKGAAYACLDHESWKTSGWPITPEAIVTWQANADRYLALIKRVKAAAPNVRWGYYGVAPMVDAGAQISTNLASYQVHNNRVQAVADECGVLFPVLYGDAFRPFTEWLFMATAAMREARRLAKGKPVYAFLWYRWVDNQKLVPAETFAKMLDFCEAWADGAVIWGFDPWDENAHWWQVTKRHIP